MTVHETMRTHRSAETKDVRAASLRAVRSAAVVAAVAALAALGASQASASHLERMGPAGVSVAQAPFDQQFIDMMAAHHSMAIEMARLALKRAKHPELKAMARKIIAAQTKEIGQFRNLRRQWYGDPNFVEYEQGVTMMRQMGMGPNEMTGLMRTNRFDYAFLSAMISHHSGANVMARWETQAGMRPVLRRIAMKIIRDQAKEVGQMIQMRVEWYGA